MRTSCPSDCSHLRSDPQYHDDISAEPFCYCDNEDLDDSCPLMDDARDDIDEAFRGLQDAMIAIVADHEPSLRQAMIGIARVGIEDIISTWKLGELKPKE